MSQLDLRTPREPARLRTGSLWLTLRSNATLLGGFLGAMWVVQILALVPFLPSPLYFGIRPRTLWGLTGIPLAPFLHGGFQHLLSNTVPFVLLGGMVLLGGRGVFWRVTVFVIALGGFGVWLFAGSYSVHVGASGLIFGYLGFLLARGIVERSVVWMLLSALIFFSYGGMLYGVLPNQPGVSWQSHLFGFLAGIGAAKVMFGRERRVLG